MKSLGEKIRYYRTLRDWTQDDMADKMKLSLPAYSKIERNITDVSYSRLKQIAQIFGITLAELVTLSDKPLESETLRKELAEKEKEINQLQKKIIELLEQKK